MRSQESVPSRLGAGSCARPTNRKADPACHLARGDKSVALRALSSTAPITLGDNDPIDIAELVEQLDGSSWTKMNSAGPTVTVSLNSAHGRGIMFADVAWQGKVINRVRYFPA